MNWEIAFSVVGMLGWVVGGVSRVGDGVGFMRMLDWIGFWLDGLRYLWDIKQRGSFVGRSPKVS